MMNDQRLERRLRVLSDPPAPDGLRARLDAAIPNSFGRPRAVRVARGIGTVGRWAALVAAPAALAVYLVTALVLAPATPVAFAAVLEPVVKGTADAGAVHYILHRLTQEGEDFSFVDLDGPGLMVEVWVESPRDGSGAARFRMEKPDRVVAFDGEETLLYMTRRNEAYRTSGPNRRGAAYWPANWIRELREQPGGKIEQVLYEERDDGTTRLVYREPGVDTSPLPKAFLGDYDRETELRWKTDTHALTALRTWVFVNGARRLYSELTAIEYLPEAPEGIFRLDLPEDVRFGGVRAGSPGQNALGPREVARGLFEAARRKDRGFLELYVPSPATVDWALSAPLIEILYIGEPFRAGNYVGVYVPYKIRVGDRIKEWNLALRNDNPERRWVFDGGI